MKMYVDVDRDDYGVVYEQETETDPCPTCGHPRGRSLPMQITLVRKGDGHWSDWPVTIREPYPDTVSLHDQRVARAEAGAFAGRVLKDVAEGRILFRPSRRYPEDF